MLLSLFFTFISSLASGQWESDQFLFNSTSPVARPKAKNKRSATTTDLKSEPIKKDNTPELNAQVVESTDSKKVIEGKRKPSGLENQTPITLDIKLGAIDFSSKTQATGMSFSKSSYSFNGTLSFPVNEKDKASFFYTSTTEVSTGAGNARWEDWGGSYKREFNHFEQRANFGFLLRQHSWWRTNDNVDYSLKSINGAGVCGSYFLPAKGLWTSEVNIQALPFLSNEKESLRGSSFGLDWMGYYPLSFARSLIVNIGYERIELKSPSNSQFDLNQSLLKISIGYRLSNSR